MVDLSPKTKTTLKRAGVVLLVVLGVSVLAWYFIVNPYLIRKEKQRFEAAAAELEELSQQIQQKIGSPLVSDSRESCGRANLKSEKGPLLCSVNEFHTYTVQGTPDANNLLNSVKAFNAAPLREGPFAKDTQFIDSSKKTTQVIYQDIGNIKGLSCVVSYEYRPSGSEVESNVDVILSCGGPARVEHYPIAS